MQGGQLALTFHACYANMHALRMRGVRPAVCTWAGFRHVHFEP